ncbi:DUF7344 domain-containing protein [Natronosalvus rutilus]|uniref:DUF7344 domain-containing protein n=1 Tax=Natronosalvus rutilus TaxID=2953753 RepID=A0A9E7SX81_9EURY|nr:hypothetical protein [Natronosalvus rutilus]UTF53893.1 hypothetical protein NGM29_01005 [Natronosalvus rutilus]
MTTNIPSPALFEQAGEVTSTFDLLADQRRRVVVRYLEETTGPATLGELAEEISVRESSGRLHSISDHADAQHDHLRSITISLHHVHIPKLADADAIDYDPETKTALLTETGERIAARMDAICGEPRDTYDRSS